jgi:hypothetical protein
VGVFFGSFEAQCNASKICYGHGLPALSNAKDPCRASLIARDRNWRFGDMLVAMRVARTATPITE